MTPPIFTTSGACRQAVQHLLKEKSSSDTPILASASCLYMAPSSLVTSHLEIST
jgi:hypothetical protein